MSDASPSAQANRFFVYCRFWPGFTEIVPYDRINPVLDDDVGPAFEAALRTAVAPPPPPEPNREQQIRSREEYLKKIAKQSQRRRQCGNGAHMDPGLRNRDAAAAKAKGVAQAQAVAKRNILAGAEDFDFEDPWAPEGTFCPTELMAFGQEHWRLIFRATAYKWHIGDSTRAPLKGMMQFWGGDPWSSSDWIYTVEGTEELVKEVIAKAKEEIEVLGIDEEWKLPLMASKHANARFGFAPALNYSYAEQADIRERIERLKTTPHHQLLDKSLHLLMAAIGRRATDLLHLNPAYTTAVQVDELVTINDISLLAGVAVKTMCNLQSTLPEPVVFKAGRSPARYSYAAIRIWAATNYENRASCFPVSFTEARARLDGLRRTSD